MKLTIFFLIVAAVVLSLGASAQARPVKQPPAFPAPVTNPTPVSA